MNASANSSLRGAADGKWAAFAFCVIALWLQTVAPARAAGSPEEVGVRALRERLGSDWGVWRTPSVRVFARAGNAPVPARLLAVEEQVQRLARRLHVPIAALRELRDGPIDYFLVNSPRIMDEFGAGDIEGLAYPASRLVVSTRLPHEHELVHVLVPLAVPRRPTSSQPFLQEGLATYLGGNGVDAEHAVLAHAATVFDREHVDLASLWTAAGWRGSALAAYDRYAVAARFVQFLVEERADMPTLLALARLLAGREQDVESRPWSAVRVQIEGVYDVRWDDLERDFDRWRRAHAVAGLREVTAPERAADHVAADDRHVVRVWIEPDAWVVALAAHRGPVDADLYWGAPQLPVNALTSAPGSGHRLRLHVDEQGIELIDRHADRVLLRSAWEADATPSVVAPALERRERVFRIGGEALDTLDAPVPIGVWSRPLFEPR